MNSTEGSSVDRGERQVDTGTVRQESRQQVGVGRNNVVASTNVEECDTTRRECETSENDDKSPAKCLGRNYDLNHEVRGGGYSLLLLETQYRLYTTRKVRCEAYINCM
jgi:hypothetical protein